MQKFIKGAAILVLATALPSMAVAAAGTPQRSDQLPPGLAKKLNNLTPGLLRAIIATQGSNSRLQDLPVSP
jgi:hypothetical protein